VLGVLVLSVLRVLVLSVLRVLVLSVLRVLVLSVLRVLALSVLRVLALSLSACRCSGALRMPVWGANGGSKVRTSTVSTVALLAPAL
jgi:hypothetical protein